LFTGSGAACSAAHRYCTLRRLLLPQGVAACLRHRTQNWENTQRAFSQLEVARAGIEPATFHFSGGRSYRLSYLASNERPDPVSWTRPDVWRP